LQSTTTTVLPYRGTPDTVKQMIALARGPRGSKSFKLRSAVEDVIRFVRPRDYWSETLALFYWACSPQFRYTRDPLRVEQVKDPVRMIDEIQTRGQTLGDCDDLTTFLVACIESIGGKARIVTVGFREPDGKVYDGPGLDDPVFRIMTSPHPRLPGPFSHVFCQGLTPRGDGWVTLDPVAGPRIGEMHKRVKQVRVYQP
jgi:transglutaminase-like putative cysteine protease